MSGAAAWRVAEAAIIGAYTLHVLQDTNGPACVISTARNRFIRRHSKPDGGTDGTMAELAYCPYCLAPYIITPIMVGVALAGRTRLGRHLVDTATAVAAGALMRALGSTTL